MGFVQVFWLEIRLDSQGTAVLENPILFTAQKPKEITFSLGPSVALEICNLLMTEITRRHEGPRRILSPTARQRLVPIGPPVRPFGAQVFIVGIEVKELPFVFPPQKG